MKQWSEPPLTAPGLDAEDWERGRVRPPAPPLSDELRTAADLVAQAVCSPQCLVSAGAPHGRLCACVCEGLYHGVVATVDIRELLARRGRRE